MSLWACEWERKRAGLPVLPFLVQVHAAYSGGVAVKRVDTFSRLGVPHLQRAVRRAADDDVVPHLGRPHATRVAHQCPQTLKTQQRSLPSDTGTDIHYRLDTIPIHALHIHTHLLPFSTSDGQSVACSRNGK